MRIPRSLHRLLNRLGPYQSLLILAIPLAIVEPLKLVALFVVGEGRFVDNDLRLRGKSFRYRAPIPCPQTEAPDPVVVCCGLAMVCDRSRQARLVASPNVDASAQGRPCILANTLPHRLFAGCLYRMRLCLPAGARRHADYLSFG
jgi:hypothetical protein